MPGTVACPHCKMTVTLWVIVACLAAPGCRAKSGGSQPAVDQERVDRHRDYFSIMEQTTRRFGVESAAVEWGDNAGNYAGFKDSRGTPGRLVVTKRLVAQYEVHDPVILLLRERFLKRHGIESKDWTPEFVSDYPQWKLLDEEIKLVARDVVQKHLSEVSEHLAKEHVKIANASKTNDPDKEFASYRESYLQGRGKMIADEMRRAVANMKTIADVRNQLK